VPEYHLQPEDQLCFIRIPKTGSTTLVSILDAQFHVADICPVLMPDIPQADPADLAKYRLFRSHCDYDIYRYLPRKPVYLTMLRHPLKRAISFYEFCQRGQRGTRLNRLLKQATQNGIREFICHPDPAVRLRTSNLQTRQLAMGLGSVRSGGGRRQQVAESQEDRAELLHLAKQHLEECVFVGLTEQFHESIALLCYTFGWYPATDYQNLRVADKKLRPEDLSQADTEAILAANHLDLVLYDYAQEIFNQRFSEMVRSLSWHYGEVETIPLSPDLPLTPDQRADLSRYLERHYEQRFPENAGQPRRSFDFDFEQPLSGKGWHRRNGPKSGLQTDATPFRWTGPATESILDLPLATGSDLQFRLRLTNAAAPDILDSLRLQVNDCPIPSQRTFQRDAVTVFEGTIPQPVLAWPRPFTRFCFQVNRTVALREVNPASGDDRVVGLAVQRLQLFPATSTPQQENFTEFLFPAKSKPWVAIATLLETYHNPGEGIAAPLEFSEPFPGGWRDYSRDLTHQPDLTWLILHKTSLAEVHPANLAWAVNQLRAVVANEVLIVFTTRTDLPALSNVQIHLRSFWRSWLLLQRKQGLAAVGSATLKLIRRLLA
jgi:hypothetical protein